MLAFERTRQIPRSSAAIDLTSMIKTAGADTADTVVLNATQLPATTTALFFQGTVALTGVPFGDGLRCAGSTTVRLATKTAVGGACTYPQAGDPSVSVKGQVTALGTRTYQTWYRNAAAFCTASTFNLTNGLSILWQ